MPSALIQFDLEEDMKIEFYSKKWNLSKHNVVKRIVLEFEEKRKK